MVDYRVDNDRAVPNGRKQPLPVMTFSSSDAQVDDDTNNTVIILVKKKTKK